MIAQDPFGVPRRRNRNCFSGTYTYTNTAPQAVQITVTEVMENVIYTTVNLDPDLCAAAPPKSRTRGVVPVDLAPPRPHTHQPTLQRLQAKQRVLRPGKSGGCHARRKDRKRN